MERLQKVIANAGITSRRKAEDLISKGIVEVNGKIIRELGYKVSPSDTIKVNGKKIKTERKVYFLLNKPRGVVSTVEDDKERKTVIDLISCKERIYPVGRLDYDTTGVLLLTNDGVFANNMMHPSKKIDKVYVAKINGKMKTEDFLKLENGIIIDNQKTAPAKVRLKKYDKDKDISYIKITIHEGKNHQVKKMFEVLGYRVLKLKREREFIFGLNGLASGEYRPLTQEEIKMVLDLNKK